MMHCGSLVWGSLGKINLTWQVETSMPLGKTDIFVVTRGDSTDLYILYAITVQELVLQTVGVSTYLFSSLQLE